MLHVLGLPNIIVESVHQVALTLEYYAQGLDFADALHLASSQQANMFYTFDVKFIRRAHAIGVPVKQPSE
jgi:predicted nucleic acid-binding protein